MDDSPIKVLLVEDNPGDARLLQEALAEAEGIQFELTHVLCLNEALERLGREAFDVMLLDLGLPESHGLDTLLTARAQAPRVPIVVLTGLGDEALAIQALREGAQDYLVKTTQDSNHLVVRSLRYAIERQRVAELQEAQQRQIAFISLASHELRTPMTTVMGFAELLLDRSSLDPVPHKWAEFIYSGSQRMTTIVDDLLNVSRVQSGKLVPHLERLFVREAVEEALTSIRSSTDRHEFSIQLPPDLPQVASDRDKLIQVLTNLLDNAIKYSPQGGPITISAYHEPKREQVVIGVADRGLGIAPEDREDLFTTFHRIRRPETDSIKGTGLGLYLVKTLVELLQGDVWLESELNQGSTFFFSVPTRWVYGEDQRAYDAPLQRRLP